MPKNKTMQLINYLDFLDIFDIFLILNCRYYSIPIDWNTTCTALAQEISGLCFEYNKLSYAGWISDKNHLKAEIQRLEPYHNSHATIKKQ